MAHDLTSTFEPDVVYMPVPRCDMCAHWTPPVSRGEKLPMGACRLSETPTGKLSVFLRHGTVWTTADFGCVQ